MYRHKDLVTSKSSNLDRSLNRSRERGRERDGDGDRERERSRERGRERYRERSRERGREKSKELGRERGRERNEYSLKNDIQYKEFSDRNYKSKDEFLNKLNHKDDFKEKGYLEQKKEYSNQNEYNKSKRSKDSLLNTQDHSHSPSSETEKQEKNSADIKPNFELSGKLAFDTNKVNGALLKYNEPPEARVPQHKWRIYVFKGKDQIDMLKVHRSSAYMFGRDRRTADIPVDHPSCSGQHSVLQYRQVTEDTSVGPTIVIRPYIIDLDSTNGTFVNSNKIPAQRFVQLLPQDVIKFGFSTREYVLIQE
ncbi:hypothetical protein BB561_002671 [Smittium simulii]|uniref:FHA domain-containing protein n=1 Tax=Smittium simulii TaxID=133385 RepID=A0A2T9YPP7_9FUNG|nr:hypothetical protein BB561_002671 [Smittium simulii]